MGIHILYRKFSMLTRISNLFIETSRVTKNKSKTHFSVYLKDIYCLCIQPMAGCKCQFNDLKNQIWNTLNLRIITENVTLFSKISNTQSSCFTCYKFSTDVRFHFFFSRHPFSQDTIKNNPFIISMLAICFVKI